MIKRFSTAALILMVAACGSDADKGKGGFLPNSNDNVEPGSAELAVGEPSGDLVEGAPPITIGLSLKSAPAAPVTVSISSLSPEVVLEPGQVEFDTNTFATPQRVSVSVTDNLEVSGDRTAQIDFVFMGEESTFDGRSVSPLTLPVIEDDATPSFDVVSPIGAFEVSEDGASIVLDVTLSMQPDGEVLVPLAVDDADEARIDVTQMTFAELTWNIPQQVTVTGLDDGEADGDTTFNLVLGPPNSTGELYNGAPATNVSIVNIDGVCGNGVVDGSEPCEPIGNPRQTCAYGEMSCTYCTASCTEAQGTVSGYCGDGTIQPHQGEACDPAVSACCDNACQMNMAYCEPDCLIISRYTEGSGFNKGVEIYNCGAQTEPLDGIVMCVYQNDYTSCSGRYKYSGTLAAGDTFSICHSSSTDPGARGACDDFESNVTRFNGDDRLALFADVDGNGYFDEESDVMLDAFGELAVRGVRGGNGKWADLRSERCNFAPYLGTGSFNVRSFYDTEFSPTTPFLNFGTPPSQGCP